MTDIALIVEKNDNIWTFFKRYQPPLLRHFYRLVICIPNVGSIILFFFFFGQMFDCLCVGFNMLIETGAISMQWILLYLVLSFIVRPCVCVLKDSGGVQISWEKAFLDVLNAELISAPPPQSPAPMTTELSSPSPLFLSDATFLPRSFLLSTSSLWRTSHIRLLYRAFSFIVQLQGYISMLISPWRDWILKGRGLRRRWAAEGERDWERLIAELSGPGSMGERRPPGSVMAGWESLRPSAPKHDYSWHWNGTGGCLIYFRVTKGEKARQREKWKTKERSWRKKCHPTLYSLQCTW